MTGPEAMQVRRRAADRERKRMVSERNRRMRGASRRWTSSVLSAISKRSKRGKK